MRRVPHVSMMYRYVREGDRDVQVDEEAVAGLLEERNELRSSRDYAGADAILEELRMAYSVSVSDDKRTWRVFDPDEPQRSSEQYERHATDRAPIDEELVYELLEERSELRRNRDFAGADSIREELRAMGVEIYDRDHMWRVEKSLRQSSVQGGFDSGWDDDGGYTRDPSDTAECNVELVQALIAERAELRSAREFDEADTVREKLRAMHVFVSDRDRWWRVDTAAIERAKRQRPDELPDGHDYSRVDDDAVALDDEQVSTINRLISLRLTAKLDRQFDRADELLEELRELGVQVNDGRKAWRADGGGFEPRPYRRVGGVHGDEQRVADLVQQRADARKVRNYAIADEIAISLSNLGVSVDDIHRTWEVTGSAGGYVRTGRSGPPDVEAQIEQLLSEREEYRHKKMFSKADAIQNTLRFDMGVVLDNRKKTWSFGQRRERQ